MVLGVSWPTRSVCFPRVVRKRFPHADWLIQLFGQDNRVVTVLLKRICHYLLTVILFQTCKKNEQIFYGVSDL